MFSDIWVIFLCIAVLGLCLLGELLQSQPRKAYYPRNRKTTTPPTTTGNTTQPPIQQPTIPKDELALPLTDERDQGEERAQFYRGKEQDKKLEKEKQDLETKEKTLKLREEEVKVYSLQRALERDKKTFDDRLKLHKERDSLYK